MRCPSCGREMPDHATFCEVCGQPLRQQPAPLYAQPAKEEVPAKWAARALPLMIAGIVIGLLGGIMYGVAVVGELAEWFEDPWAEDQGPDLSLGLVLVSYALMGIGVALFFVGLLFLVLKSA